MTAPRNDSAPAGTEASVANHERESAKDSTVLRDDDTRRRLNSELRKAKAVFSAAAADALKGVQGAGNLAMTAHLEVERLRQELARLDEGGR